MRFLEARLQGFRNIDFAKLDISHNRVFFCGANAQGKSNLMEGLGLVTALRSFRAHEQRFLLRQGSSESILLFRVEHESYGNVDVHINLRPNTKEVFLDGDRVKRFSDFVGRFPVVAFSSQDIQLLRGAPSLRRRFMDLMLASMDGVYLETLQQYHRALRSRNQLLKAGGVSIGSLPSFEKILAGPAALLVTRRAESISLFSEKVQQAYARISGGKEEVQVEYLPDLALFEKGAMLECYEKHRQRDILMRSTQKGPHRDDLSLKIEGRSAREYASEGQQRSLVLALKLAQVAYFYEKSNVRPVILADDILGELDLARQEGFYAALDPLHQVLATGTQRPRLGDPSAWMHYEVTSGAFNLLGNIVCQD